jgi:hypothetical protein
MTPNINPIHWHQAQGVACDACARIRRAGGSAADAMSAFGLVTRESLSSDWTKAVEVIAEQICRYPWRRAA